MTESRRDAVLAAAVEVLGTVGSRGFTHRAVDRAAGLAEGSTSYYFRTRQTLLLAALARLTELDAAEAAAFIGAKPPADLDALAKLLAVFLERWLTTGRERTLARYELTLESTRQPELRRTLVESGEWFRTSAVRLLAGLGAADAERRGRDLVAYLDGLVFDQLVGAGTRPLGRARLRASCRDLLRVLLTDCQQQP